MKYSAFFIAFSSRKKIEKALAENLANIQVSEGLYYTAEEQANPACMVYVEKQNDVQKLIEFGREFRPKTLSTNAFSKGYGAFAWTVDFSGYSAEDVQERVLELGLDLPLLEIFIKEDEDQPEVIIFYHESEETQGYDKALADLFDYSVASIIERGATNLGK